MAHPQIRRVAVIGAGISGVVSAAHLLAVGLEVTVFERNHSAGGVWLFDERKPLEPKYTLLKPLESENQWDESLDEDDVFLSHAPPGPCYKGLRNNVSTPLMRVKLNAWPEGTPDFVSHSIMRDYIQDTSRKTGVHNATIYGARVKKISKDGNVWSVTWSTLKLHHGSLRELETNAVFDAIIVASGHYHSPRIPNTPGLAEAKAKWPGRIMHSKGYRRPEDYKDKTVLLIGGGVSSIDIAREIGPYAKTIYQSTRNGEFDISPSMLPDSGLRIGEVNKFELQNSKILSVDEALPLRVQLTSGQNLCDIDIVIICTGYHITVPFLAGYHNDNLLPEEADQNILVTDGSQMHNLYKDIFYIPDPTLAFVGVPYYTATFTLFEFQAIVVANLFAGITDLPAEVEMREEYEARILSKGAGKRFHSLKDIEEIYVRDLLLWVNKSREKRGLYAIEGHTNTWHHAKKEQRERIAALFQGSEKRDSAIGVLPVFLDTCSGV